MTVVEIDPAFSWDAVYKRRRALAASVQTKLGLSFKFGGARETFNAIPLTDQMLALEELACIPFYVLASRLNAQRCHVIDHAFWLIANDDSREPWGFVTEPYIKPDLARKLAANLEAQHKCWGIQAYTLHPDQSAWLPGRTTPIIVTATPGNLFNFLKLGVQDALNLMQPG